MYKNHVWTFLSTWGNLLLSAVSSEVLENAMASDVEFRRGLPINYRSFMGYQHMVCATHSLMKIWCKFCEVYLFWVLRSTSVSHQCGPCSILGWGSDPSAVSEKGFVPVWATLRPWVGTLSRWPSLSAFTNPRDSKELTRFSKRVGESPRCCDPSSTIYHIH